MRERTNKNNSFGKKSKWVFRMLSNQVALTGSQPPPKKQDVQTAIKAAFRFVGQDIMAECTFRHLLYDIIIQQRESYTILLRLWEEHDYIVVLRQPGKPRVIEIGPIYERDYSCLL